MISGSLIKGFEFAIIIINPGISDTTMHHYNFAPRQLIHVAIIPIITDHLMFY